MAVQTSPARHRQPRPSIKGASTRTPSQSIHQDTPPRLESLRRIRPRIQHHDALPTLKRAEANHQEGKAEKAKETTPMKRTQNQRPDRFSWLSFEPLRPIMSFCVVSCAVMPRSRSRSHCRSHPPCPLSIHREFPRFRIQAVGGSPFLRWCQRVFAFRLRIFSVSVGLAASFLRPSFESDILSGAWPRSNTIHDAKC